MRCSPVTAVTRGQMAAFGRGGHSATQPTMLPRQRPSALWVLPAALAAVMGSVASADSPPSYTVIDLGPITPGFSDAFRINETGVVAGRGSVPNSDFHALLWLVEPQFGLPAGVHSLGSLNDDGDPALTNRSVARDINDAGIVAGWSNVPATDQFGNTAMRAIRWSAKTGMQELPTLGGVQSIANGINAAGDIVGQAELDEDDPDGFPLKHATLWKDDGTVIDLGTFGGLRSVAHAINDLGQVVGQAWYDDGEPYNSRIHQFLWLPEPAYGLPSGLNDIDPNDTIDLTSNAKGINVHGQVVGWISEFIPGGGIRTKPSLWLPEPAHGLPAGMNDLGSLVPDGGGFGEAVNDHGQVVGSAVGSFADFGIPIIHGFVWENGVMRDLNELIELEPGDNVFIGRAFGINNAGQIVGIGVINGGFHGYLLDPIVDEILGDLNGDGVVDVEDLFILLSDWGECDDCDKCAADLTGNCAVDVEDLFILLSNWS